MYSGIVIGNLYDISFLKLVGSILAWIVALIGASAAALFAIYYLSDTVKKISRFLIVDNDEEAEEIRELTKSSDKLFFIFSVENLEYSLLEVIPYWVDVTLDIIFVMVLVYFDYAWLPLVYLIHIIGFYKSKKGMQELLENGEYFSITKFDNGEYDADYD
jgi:hypothetical protein